MFELDLINRVYDARRCTKPIDDKLARQIAKALKDDLWRARSSQLPSTLTTFVNDGSYELADFVHMLHDAAVDRHANDVAVLDSLRAYAEWATTSTAGRGPVEGWSQD